MNGRYLLDTSVIIDLFDNDAAVKDKLAAAAETFDL
jgi:predicted nucleic acid-binding protein